MNCIASSGAGCAVRWCRTARTAAVWLVLSGSAGAIEPSGSVHTPADPFAKRGAAVGTSPAAAAIPSNDSAGIAQLKPIETPYVPYHATATSPWMPRAVDPPPPIGTATTPYVEPSPAAEFESIFDPTKLVPVVLPDVPAAPPAATDRTPAGNDDRSATSYHGDLLAPPVVDTGRMTPVTFGPAAHEKPVNPAAPIERPLAKGPDNDATSRRPPDETPQSAPLGRSPVGKTPIGRPPVAEAPFGNAPLGDAESIARPATPQPPVAAKYHLPQPPIPLP